MRGSMGDRKPARTRRGLGFWSAHFALLAALSAAPAFAADPVPPGFVLEDVVVGADFPTALVFTPPPDDRAFFTEKNTGNVRILQGGTVLPQPLIHLDDAAGDVYTNEGMIGLVLDPAFAENGYVYIAYTQETGAPGVNDCPGGEEKTRHNRLVRATASGDSAGDVVELLTWPSGTDRHGGELAFAPDGTLLLQTGDVECNIQVGDPPHAYSPLSQDLATLAGKMLRIEPDGTIPADNPFVGSAEHPEARPEIFAYGFRNGFGMYPLPEAVSPLAIVATENGPAANDEINVVVAGGNYGWGLHQGYDQPDGFADPIFVWTPAPPFRTVAPTGILRYDGAIYPRSYRGDYFVGYANFQGVLRTESRVQRFELTEDGAAVASNDAFVNVDLGGYANLAFVVDLAQGPDGLLYFLTGSGIYRVNMTIEALLQTIVEDDSMADLGEIVRRLRTKAKIAG